MIIKQMSDALRFWSLQPSSFTEEEANHAYINQTRGALQMAEVLAGAAKLMIPSTLKKELKHQKRLLSFSSR